MTHLPARRKVINRGDGSSIAYSIPEGVTDEQAAAEVERCMKRVRRGYSAPLRFRDSPIHVNVRWFARLPRWAQQVVLRAIGASRAAQRAADDAAAFVKFRALDAYWFVRDRSPPQTNHEEPSNG